jgi:hypothetical protein
MYQRESSADSDGDEGISLKQFLIFWFFILTPITAIGVSAVFVAFYILHIFKLEFSTYFLPIVIPLFIAFVGVTLTLIVTLVRWVNKSDRKKNWDGIDYALQEVERQVGLKSQRRGIAKEKSMLIAVWLSFFLGFFGAGNFYLGNMKKGRNQILVTMFTGIGGFIWGWIDVKNILFGKISSDIHGNVIK